MKYTIYTFVFLVALLISCSESDPTPEVLTVENFESELTLETTYDQIVSAFGEPALDRGSGIHIYVYELEDDTEMWIGYVDQILFARHMDLDGNEIRTLLSRGVAKS